ncbi:MAG TPA: transposase [Planctomycetota bacterium]|nr:transposase [Planctomycetota bacterium]
MVACGHGTPLGACVSPGQDHESRHLEEALGSVALPYAWTGPRFTPGSLAGDKAYTGERIRGMLEVLGVRPVIAHQVKELQKPWEVPFDRAAYRRRNVIERVVGYLKECRRVATRYEKLALSYLAMVKLAMIHRCLRLLFSYGT